MITTITVSSAAGLMDALAHATGGETIQLAAGDYGKLAMNTYSGFNVNYPSNVTITSADPLHPASFSGMDLRGVSNLTINGVVGDYSFTPGDQLYTAPFSVTGGSNIAITNSTFTGDVASGMTAVDNGYPTGIGLSIRGTTGVTLAGNDISSFYRGLAVSTCNAVTVSGNDVHGIRMDGMDFCQIQGGNITGNHIHDFHTSPQSLDHCDMIQFWTAGTTAPSTNINISGNVLDIGNGGFTQSIFMRNEMVDEGLAGKEMDYQNISITNNLITNGQLHGITVGETDGLTISQNSVLHSDGNLPDGADGSVEIPQINLASASTHVVVTGNVTAAINGWVAQPDWTVSHNAFVQDQNPVAPGYYGDVFISSSLTSTDGVHQFLALPGAMIDLLGAGAAATHDYLPDGDAVAALFQATEDHGGAVQTRYFDASLSMTSAGGLPAGAVVQWSFGDGTTATGLKVVHNYAAGGHYDVSMTVVLPGGASDTTQGVIGVQDSTILTQGADGVFRAYDYENTIALPGNTYETAAGIQLGSTGVAAVIARSHVSDILLAQDFDITMKLHADSRFSYGEVFRLNGSFSAYVTTKGELSIQTFSSNGTSVQLTSTGISVTDLHTHTIDLRLHDGLLQLWVDGKVAAQSAFAGTLQSYGSLDMTFGNQWGQKNFYGDVSAFNVRVGEVGLGGGKQILSLGSDGQFHGTDGIVAGHAAIPAPGDVATSGLHLGDAGVVASVSGSLLTDLVKAQNFDVALQIHADSADSKGNVFVLSNSLVGRVNNLGEFVIFAVDTSGAVTRVATSGAHMADGTAHNVDIRLNSGNLQLWVDGTLSAQSAFSGTLHDNLGGNLNFGNGVAPTNFHGDLSGFDVSVTSDVPDGAAQAQALHAASAWTSTVA